MCLRAQSFRATVRTVYLSLSHEDINRARAGRHAWVWLVGVAAGRSFHHYLQWVYKLVAAANAARLAMRVRGLVLVAHAPVKVADEGVFFKWQVKT